MAVAELNTLRKLDFSKQLTFAYVTSERFYSISQFFTEQYNFGDKNLLRNALDFVYNAIFSSSLKTATVDHLLQSIYKNFPGTNQFPNFHGTMAMYSGGIIYESVNLLKKTMLIKY